MLTGTEASVSALRHCSVSAFTSASAGPPKPSETSFRPTASRMLFTPTLKSWSGHTSSGRMTSCVTSSDLTREPPTSIQPSSVSGLQRSAPAILSLPLPSASAGLVTASSPSDQEKQRRHSSIIVRRPIGPVDLANRRLPRPFTFHVRTEGGSKKDEDDGADNSNNPLARYTNRYIYIYIYCIHIIIVLESRVKDVPFCNKLN